MKKCHKTYIQILLGVSLLAGGCSQSNPNIQTHSSNLRASPINHPKKSKSRSNPQAISEKNLELLLGRSFKEVLAKLGVKIEDTLVINEPPGICRGLSSHKVKISLYVKRINALHSFKKGVQPQEFLQKKVEGIAYYSNGKWLRVGQGVIWYYHSN